MYELARRLVHWRLKITGPIVELENTAVSLIFYELSCSSRKCERCVNFMSRYPTKALICGSLSQLYVQCTIFVAAQKAVQKSTVFGSMLLP